jgi:chemotaxis protein MotB
MSAYDDGYEDGGAHGGSWKIALADLMTVLMVFFLVMWLAAIMDPADRKNLANAFKDPKPTGGAQESSPLPEVKGDVLLNPLELKPLTKSEIEIMIKDLDASVEETPEQLIIIIKSDKAFESGRANLQEGARAKLELIAERLASRRNRLTITGHTDNIPIHNVTYPSNWELSSARASSVARLFEAFGMQKQFITVAGRADAEPVSDNDTNIGRAQNRRVVISVDKEDVPPPELAKPAKPAAKPKPVKPQPDAS